MRNPLGALVRYLVLPLLLFAILAVASILVTRFWMQKTAIRLERIDGVEAIDRLESLTLGGVKQWLLLRGRKDAPPLVWLHGGPGGPSSLAFARALDTEIVKHFLVIHWDQRGTGKSYTPEIRPDTMTVQQLLSDLEGLIGHLRRTLGKPKVILLGHQWGSVLGLLYAYRRPQDLLAWVGVSQIVDWVVQEKASYHAVLEQARRATQKEAISELEALGEPPYKTSEASDTLKKWAAAYQGVYFKTPNLSGLLKASLGSPEYTLGELFRFSQGVRFSQATLRQDAIRQAKFLPARPLRLPAFFFQGRHDLLTGGEALSRFFNDLQAPFKELVWFEASSHYPDMEERKAFEEALVKNVLPRVLAQPPASRPSPLLEGSALPTTRP